MKTQNFLLIVLILIFVAMFAMRLDRLVQTTPVIDSQSSPSATQSVVSLVPVSTFGGGGLRQVFQIGHHNLVQSVAFSPNGKLILSGASEEAIKLWDAATGREIRTLTTFWNGNNVTFSPDGYLALADDQEWGKWGRNSRNARSVLKFWDVFTGKQKKIIETDLKYSIDSVAFSPDGRLILGSGDALKLWDVVTGGELKSFEKVRGPAVFLPNGISFISNWEESGKYGIRLWEVATGEALYEFGMKHYASYSVGNLAISPNGHLALSQYNDKNIKLWDVTRKIELRELTPDFSTIKKFMRESNDELNEDDITEQYIDCDGKIAFSSDSRLALSECHLSIIAGLGEVSVLTLWDVDTGKELKNLTTKEAYIKSFAFSPDNLSVLYGAGSDLRLWNINTGEISTFSQFSHRISSAAFSPDGGLILFAVDKTLKLWDAITGTELRTFFGHYDYVRTVAFFSNSHLSISGGDDHKLQLWDVNTGKELRTFSGHEGPVSDVAVSPNGRFAVSGSGSYGSSSAITDPNPGDGTVRIWEITTGRELHNLITERWSSVLRPVAFSPGGKIILSIDGNKWETLPCLWSVKTGKKIRTFTGTVSRIELVAFSPDGRLILTAANDNDFDKKGLRLWNVLTGKELRTFAKSKSYIGIYSLAFSPNGNFAVSGNSDNKARIWDVSTGEEIRTLIGHTGAVTSVAFSPDNLRLLSGSNDGTLRTWDVSSGQEIVKMISTTDGEWSINTPDGYYNTSPEGKSAVHYASDTETYSFEQFESLFRRPDIIQARLAGDLKAGTPAPKLTRPPRVTLVSTRNLTPTTDKAIYPLAITATSHDDLVQTVRVFVNGKPALEKPVNAKEQRLDFEVPLFAGPNRITTVAYDRKGFSSNQASIDIISTVPGAKKPTLFVMAVGISQYPKMSKGDQLDYAHTDAQNLVKTLRQQKGQLFTDVRDFTLINQEAAPRAITDGLHALSAMDANDIAIIFFAGHGVQSKDGRFWYVTQEGSLKQPETGGLDWQTLNEHFNRIKGRVILFLDACHSGSITDETIVPNDQLAAKFFKGGMGGVMVFSASKGRQTSLENETIGGGLFTHYLTQGLKAKETDRDNNGFVEFMELVDYVSKAVNEKTSGQQTPWLSRRELFGDLAVATVQ